MYLNNSLCVHALCYMFYFTYFVVGCGLFYYLFMWLVSLFFIATVVRLLIS